jgi:hypothetical protein
MNARLAVLGVWLAALPLAVDLPASRDSSRTSPLLVEVAGGGGQFAIVSRGCNGEVLQITRNQLRSGALVVEHRLPEDFVIGVRAGNVQTTLNTSTETHGPAPTDAVPEPTRFYANRYLNPYVGYEGRVVGLGVGVMMADQPFDANPSLGIVEDPLQVVHSRNLFREKFTTWHVRLGGDRHRLTLRWMEDVPLESEGHFSADLGFRPSRQLETGIFVGLAGPYDGTMFGLRGRVWLTPGAALQIKASTAGGETGEYGVYGSITARLPGLH